jgi:hypothetical protein
MPGGTASLSARSASSLSLKPRSSPSSSLDISMVMGFARLVPCFDGGPSFFFQPTRNPPGTGGASFFSAVFAFFDALTSLSQHKHH